MTDGYESDNSDNKHRAIEDIPWFTIPDLREYLKRIKPDKHTTIMTTAPKELTTMALQDYPAQTLKNLLSFFKAGYRDVGLGAIEEHEGFVKQKLIKELLKAIAKIKMYIDQSE
jgi:hypothetical protein